MIPIRIQRKRTKGWKMPQGAVYVGRGSKWGNPFKVGELCSSKRNSHGGCNQIFVTDNEVAVASFQRFLSLELRIAAREHLKGKNLACWCKLDELCHADVLLEIANSEAL